MKHILLFISIALTFSSCITTKKYSKIVDAQTKNAIAKQKPMDWLKITSKKTNPIHNKCTKKKNSFIPAILYWSWDSKIDCELAINTRIKYLEAGIYKAAKSLNLKERLNGNQLEIQINELPGKFMYEDFTKVIIFIFAYSYMYGESIEPYPTNLTYEYKIKNQNSVLKTGRGYVLNEELPVTINTKSPKKITSSYLNELRKETERMGFELLNNLVEKMEN